MTNLISKAEFLEKQAALKKYKEGRGKTLLEFPSLYEFQQYEKICKELELIKGFENVADEDFAAAIEFTVGYISKRFCNGEYEGSYQPAAESVVKMLTGQTPLDYLLGKK